MGYTSALETCSVEVRRGVEWLKNNMDADKAGALYAKEFYVLEKFDRELVEKYLERAKDESFWSPIEHVFREPYAVGRGWFLAKLGLYDNSFWHPRR